MNRTQLRRFLRSKLGDMHPTSPKFSDSDLNLALLNSAYFLQNLVNTTDPNPYTQTVYGDLAANIKIYPLPSDYRSPGVREVAILVDGAYKSIGRTEFSNLNKEANRTLEIASTTNEYSVGGGKIRLKIAPTTSIVAGIRIEYAAQVTFGDDDDAIIQLPIELHDCIYLFAAGLLSQDLGYPDWEKFYSFGKEIYNSWAQGFKTTIGPDTERITNVGNVNRREWPRA